MTNHFLNTINIMSGEKLMPTKTHPEFWNERWTKSEIGFHQSNNHKYLEKHLSKLLSNQNKMRILFPFCGKAVDMAWLASLGHEVVGVEFVQMACEQFFAENNIKYSVKDLKDLKLFESEDGRIKLYNGDFFKFNSELEKPFECVWDRGAYGALHLDLRIKYAQHMKNLISPSVRYLLDVFEYDTSLYPGPPHSCPLEEIQQHFGSEFQIELLESEKTISLNQKLTEANQPLDKLYFLSRK